MSHLIYYSWSIPLYISTVAGRFLRKRDIGKVSTEFMDFNNISSSKCPVGLEVLDFRPHYPCFNLTNRTKCEIQWPCEIRQYWIDLHTFVDITRGFLSYGTIIIIVVGVILNGLSFYTLISSGLAKNGSGLYLLALAVCDIGNLLTNYAIGVTRGESSNFNQYFADNEWLCRFHGVFVDIFQTISAWIVVGFTVERCIAVWYPLLLRHSRKYRSKIVVFSLATIFTLFSLSKLFLTGFEKDSVFGYTACHSERFVWQGMAYIRVAFQTWIPTIIVFVFNCLMFWKLRRIKINRERLTAYRRTSLDKRGKSYINRSSRTTPMLIAVSLAYLVLVFPLGAVQTIELYWNVGRKVPVAMHGQARLDYIEWLMIKILIKYIRSFCFGFYQLNFAINFFLYCAAGVQFRVHLQYKFYCLMHSMGFCLHTQNNNNNGSFSVSTIHGQHSGMSNFPSTKTVTSEIMLYDRRTVIPMHPNNKMNNNNPSCIRNHSKTSTTQTLSPSFYFTNNNSSTTPSQNQLQFQFPMSNAQNTLISNYSFMNTNQRNTDLGATPGRSKPQFQPGEIQLHGLNIQSESQPHMLHNT